MYACPWIKENQNGRCCLRMLNKGKMAESCVSVRTNDPLLMGAKTICWLGPCMSQDGSSVYMDKLFGKGWSD